MEAAASAKRKADLNEFRKHMEKTARDFAAEKQALLAEHEGALQEVRASHERALVKVRAEAAEAALHAAGAPPAKKRVSRSEPSQADGEFESQRDEVGPESRRRRGSQGVKPKEGDCATPTKVHVAAVGGRACELTSRQHVPTAPRSRVYPPDTPTKVLLASQRDTPQKKLPNRKVPTRRETPLTTQSISKIDPGPVNGDDIFEFNFA
jgi:hypothetical protein